MRCRRLPALLVATLLSAGIALGQRGGGFGHGGGAFRPGRPGLRTSLHFRFGRFHSRQFIDTGSVLIPWLEYPYDEPVEGYSVGNESMTSYPATLQVVAAPVDSRQVRPPETPAIPKLIEVPGSSDHSNATPAPAAIFILVTGERIEARRYLLTANELRVTIEGQPRAISRAIVDVEATVAANRSRGIALRIPLDKNEITLGF